MSEFKPYLSVVVCSRNDNHGENMMKRQQIFADCLIAQAEKHKLPMELIFVEWNPPAETPSLASAMRWPEKSPYCRVRMIEVPREEHAKLHASEALPLFQMMAKNVGIRRAEGEFVLCTNVDVIFSDELCRYIKKGLKKGVLYRNNRYDVNRDIPEFHDLEKTLDFCRNNLVRKNLPDGVYVEKDGLWQRQILIANNIPVLSYALALISKALSRNWNLHAYLMQNIKLLKSKRIIPVDHILKPITTICSRLLYFFLVSLYMIIAVIVTFPMMVRRKTWGAFLTRIAYAKSVKRCFDKYKKLNTNGCGDFNLLDKGSWMSLRGYYDKAVFSWHLDSIFLFQADTSDIPVEQLPEECVIYHVDHGGGWTIESEVKMFKWLNSSSIPYFVEKDLIKMEIKMEQARKRKEKFLFNDQDWGYANNQFKEIIVTDIK